MTVESKPNTILVIEDEKFLVEAYALKLKEAGYVIESALDGEDALEKLNAGLRPIVILLDILLPKIGGFQVLESIKRKPELKSIPIIILSNLGQEADREKGIELGADDYIIKADTTLEDIITKIQKVTR